MPARRRSRARIASAGSLNAASDQRLTGSERARGPPNQLETGIRRYSDPPDPVQADLHYYVGGFLKFGSCWYTACTGCAAVVVSPDGDVVAFRNARPPAWVPSAASAELWTIMLVLQLTVAIPSITADCNSILDAALGGTAKATAANRPLARIWNLIAARFDGDVSTLVRTDVLDWMPAHKSPAAIGSALKSTNHRLCGGLAGQSLS